jgi:CRISPR type I-E-associated protein CasB/Cse2
VLEAADPGTLAALRRAAPTSPPAAFYRVSVSVLDDQLPEGGTRRDAAEARWVVVVSAMATAQGLLARCPLGEALAKAGVAELRVLRLLEANDAQLADLVRHVVHQLVQKGQPFDPADLADLVLTAGTDRGPEPRRRIARSFYRHHAA